MTMTATQLLMNNVASFASNPSTIQQQFLNVLELGLNGDDIVDPTNSFVFLLEAAATVTCSAILKSQLVTNSLYPVLGQTTDDLYKHLSDREYVGVFSTPAVAVATINIPWGPLMNAVVDVASSNPIAALTPNANSIIIPRNTEINVNGIALSIGYPIYINVLVDSNNDTDYSAGDPDHDAIVQVLLDTSQSNPLMPVSQNALLHGVTTIGSTDYLTIQVPVSQYATASYIYPLITLAAFSMTNVFSNMFCYARVYLSTVVNGVSVWKEILTTYTPIVYDINTPTAIITLTSTTVSVSFPLIYQNSTINSNSIRIDIITSLGNVTTDLSQIPSGSYGITYNDYDTYTKVYDTTGTIVVTNLIKSINDVVVYSTSILGGGSNALTTQELQQKIIYQTDLTNALIRYTDITAALSTMGYQTQKLIDNITNRTYLASKNMPTRSINGLRIVPLSTQATVDFNVSWGDSLGAYQTTMTTHSTNRFTIKPDGLYLLNNGVITPVNDNAIAIINSNIASNTISSLNTACNILNSGTYFYTPFYYVVDFTTSYPIAVAAVLDNPTIQSKTFEAMSSIANYNIASTNISVSLINDSVLGYCYQLVITAIIPSSLTGVSCQISYLDHHTGTTVYLVGSSVTNANSVIFTFKLATSFDINSLNEINLTNMVITANNVLPVFSPLSSTFNIFYILSKAPSIGSNTTFDNLVNYGLINSGSSIGLSYETVTINFGKVLSNLYTPIIEVLQAPTYLTYQAAVYATYTEDVYATNELGKVYTIDTTTNTVTFTKLHNVGDPILDSSGNPVILYNVGDYILDVSGNKIPASNSTALLTYAIGIDLFDARYKYATDSATSSYTQTIVPTIMEYINVELGTIRDELAEDTRLYFKPRGEHFQIMVNTGNNTIIAVPAILNVELTFHVQSSYVNNANVIDGINSITRTALSNIITQTTIAESALIATLKDNAPSQVVDVSVNSFLPNGLKLVTIVESDYDKSFSIQEQITALADNTLEVTDTVVINIVSAT